MKGDIYFNIYTRVINFTSRYNYKVNKYNKQYKIARIVLML